MVTDSALRRAQRSDDLADYLGPVQEIAYDAHSRLIGHARKESRVDAVGHVYWCRFRGIQRTLTYLIIS